MISILFGILLAIVLIVVLAYWASDGSEWYNAFAAILAVLLSIATGFTTIAYCFCIWEWNASAYKAQIINREYGTNYTREEIFYAHDVIDKIQELNRQRIEINGNLGSGK